MLNTAVSSGMGTPLPPLDPESDHAGRIRGEMSTEDPVRIVEIKDIDIMCCGGTHVKNTSEIGARLRRDGWGDGGKLGKGRWITSTACHTCCRISSSNSR
ncbi:MAG: hypothetical protein GYA24_09055 [Candidatus Lokiarchaeota archaeon]|nr:hypothetical protein [Candidatus Lokiarchaeota archaeon]